MIIFSINHKFESSPLAPVLKVEGNWKKSIIDFFHNLAKKYSEIKSIYLSLNDSKADIAI
jgi:hypothetical protein